FQAEDGIRDKLVTGVQTCALPIYPPVLMVMRLDGPQEGTATQIILSSLKAERDGLQGRFAIDSTGGTAPDGSYDKKGGYREFDRSEERRVGKECRSRGEAYE